MKVRLPGNRPNDVSNLIFGVRLEETRIANVGFRGVRILMPLSDREIMRAVEELTLVPCL